MVGTFLWELRISIGELDDFSEPQLNSTIPLKDFSFASESLSGRTDQTFMSLHTVHKLNDQSSSIKDSSQNHSSNSSPSYPWWWITQP